MALSSCRVANPHIGAAAEQVGGERVPQRVRRSAALFPVLPEEGQLGTTGLNRGELRVAGRDRARLELVIGAAPSSTSVRYRWTRMPARPS